MDRTNFNTKEAREIEKELKEQFTCGIGSSADKLFDIVTR